MINDPVLDSLDGIKFGNTRSNGNRSENGRKRSFRGCATPLRPCGSPDGGDRRIRSSSINQPFTSVTWETSNILQLPDKSIAHHQRGSPWQMHDAAHINRSRNNRSLGAAAMRCLRVGPRKTVTGPDWEKRTEPDWIKEIDQRKLQLFRTRQFHAIGSDSTSRH